MSFNPIGFFDSGIGGTSIWKEVNQLLPNENTIYLADSKHAPYGPKGKDKIIELSIKNTELLLNYSCKLIVVACNTATTNAIDYLRHTYNIPFIGIEPAIKPAALKTQTNAIGILATKGTLSSELFHKTSDLYTNNIKVVEQVGEGLVELVEAGKINSNKTKKLLIKHLTPMLNANIDHLVLGCTHYPYLIPLIKTLIPDHIKIIDSGEAVARQTKAILEHYELISHSQTKSHSHRFFTNGSNLSVLNSLVENSYTTEYLDF